MEIDEKFEFSIFFCVQLFRPARHIRANRCSMKAGCSIVPYFPFLGWTRKYRGVFPFFGGGGGGGITPK